MIEPSAMAGIGICLFDDAPCETAMDRPARSMRLHIAEAPLSREVTIELEDMPAKSFDVELADNNAYILLRDLTPVALKFPHSFDVGP